MAILDSISSVFETVMNLLPRIYFMPSYEGGVLFVRGKNIKEVKPGPVFYWPITTTIETCPVNRQVLAIPAQTCSTLEGKTVVLAGVLTYKVVDVKKFLVENFEADESVCEVVSSVLRDVVSERDWDALQANNRNTVDNALGRKAATLLESYGCVVERLRITSLAPARVYQVFGHSPLSHSEEA